jgi:hypothetical protein
VQLSLRPESGSRHFSSLTQAFCSILLGRSCAVLIVGYSSAAWDGAADAGSGTHSPQVPLLAAVYP